MPRLDSALWVEADGIGTTAPLSARKDIDHNSIG